MTGGAKVHRLDWVIMSSVNMHGFSFLNDTAVHHSAFANSFVQRYIRKKKCSDHFTSISNLNINCISGLAIVKLIVYGWYI